MDSPQMTIEGVEPSLERMAQSWVVEGTARAPYRRIVHSRCVLLSVGHEPDPPEAETSALPKRPQLALPHQVVDRPAATAEELARAANIGRCLAHVSGSRPEGSGSRDME